MIKKEIIIAGVNITDILNKIIDFVLKVVKFEFPEVGEVIE